MTIVLVWFLVWIVMPKNSSTRPSPPVTPDADWVLIRQMFASAASSDGWSRYWPCIGDAGESDPRLAIAFASVGAPRSRRGPGDAGLPLIVNLVLSASWSIGSPSTTVLTDVTRPRNGVVRYPRPLFDTLRPASTFSTGPAGVRDNPRPDEYNHLRGPRHDVRVDVTAIAFLLGLILFEDRDLA